LSSLPQNSIDNLQEMATSDFTVSIAIADSAAGSSVIPMWLMFASSSTRAFGAAASCLGANGRFLGGWLDPRRKLFEAGDLDCDSLPDPGQFASVTV